MKDFFKTKVKKDYKNSNFFLCEKLILEWIRTHLKRETDITILAKRINWLILIY